MKWLRTKYRCTASKGEGYGPYKFISSINMIVKARSVAGARKKMKNIMMNQIGNDWYAMVQLGPFNKTLAVIKIEEIK